MINSLFNSSHLENKLVSLGKCGKDKLNTNLADRLYTLAQAVISTFILKENAWLESKQHSEEPFIGQS